MLRILTVFVLLTTFLTGSGIRTFITVRFHFQQEEIAKTRCENKAKPELKCNGKCQLAKELKQAEEKSSDPAQPVNPSSYSFPDLHVFPLANSDFNLSLFPTKVKRFGDLVYHPLSGTSELSAPPPES